MSESDLKLFICTIQNIQIILHSINAHSLHLFQLQLQYTRELRAVAAARELGARDAMCPQLVEKVSVAGHCDVVYISELGCGINRGAMNFGRLYQVRFRYLNIK